MNTYALLIGVERYESESLDDIYGCVFDACKMAKVLVQQGVPKENIRFAFSICERTASIMRSEAQFYEILGIDKEFGDWLSEAILQAAKIDVISIQSLIKSILSEKNIELFLLHWGGHGYVDQREESEVERIVCLEGDGSSLNLTSLLEYLRQPSLPTRLRKSICIVDTCANEQLPEGMLEPSAFIANKGRELAGQLNLFASVRGSRTSNNDEEGTGVFTDNVLRVLSRDHWPPSADFLISSLRKELVQTFSDENRFYSEKTNSVTLALAETEAEDREIYLLRKRLSRTLNERAIDECKPVRISLSVGDTVSDSKDRSNSTDLMNDGLSDFVPHNANSLEILLLGAPGSGKTTILKETACALMSRSSAIAIYLDSVNWAEKTSLAAWLDSKIKHEFNYEGGLRELSKKAKLSLLIDDLDKVASGRLEHLIDEIDLFSKQHTVCMFIAVSDPINSRLENLKVNRVVRINALDLESKQQYLKEKLIGERESAFAISFLPSDELRGLTSSVGDLRTFCSVIERVFETAEFIHESNPKSLYIRNCMADIKLKVEESRLQTLEGYTVPPIKARRWLSTVAFILEAKKVGGYKPFIKALFDAVERHSRGESLYPEVGKYSEQDEIFRVEEIQPLSWKHVLLPLLVCLPLSCAIPLYFRHLLDWWWWAVLLSAAGLTCMESLKIEAIGKFDVDLGRIGKSLRYEYSLERIKSTLGGAVIWSVSLAIGVWTQFISKWGPPDERGVFAYFCATLFTLAVVLIYLLIIVLIIPPIRLLTYKLRKTLTEVEITTRKYPNQPIWTTLQNSVIIMFVGTLICFSVNYFLAIQPYGHPFSNYLLYWIVAPLSLLIPISGFFDVLKHFLVRFLLALEGQLPLQLCRFLDYAVERSILCKDGNGYRFASPELREYFLQCYLHEKSSWETAGIEDRSRHRILSEKREEDTPIEKFTTPPPLV